MIRKARDLSPEQKTALEGLLGRAISDEEDVSIRVLQPPGHISAERRREILDALNTYFDQVDTQRKPASREHADQVIDDALRSVRPSYRSHS